MDQELDRAIDAALDEARAARPSPDFLPRLRTHVEQLPPAPIRWWIPLAASATTIAAGIIVAAVASQQSAVISQQSAVSGHQSAVISHQSAVGSQRSSVIEPPAVVGSLKSKIASRQSIVAPEPEVLVPKADRVAVARLLAALSAGDARAVAVIQSLPNDAAPGGDTAVTVAPIDIAPVVVPPLKESL
jgi:hypothetical protein